MIIFSNKLYRKLTIGLIALPLIVVCTELNARFSFFQEFPIEVVINFYLFLLLWVLYIVYKFASLEKSEYQILVMLILAFEPMLGAFLSGAGVHGTSIIFLIVHVIIAWPACALWIIYLLFSKSDS